ncbi:RNA-binding protein [bacterium]|nr:RNA-binding protein [bacterium]
MQGKKLYIGNLNYTVTDEELGKLFGEYGTVISANVIGSKGFGFVEMSSQAEAESAKTALNNFDFKGRKIQIDEARPPKKDRGRGFHRN